MQKPQGKLLALLAVFVALAMVTSTMAGLSGLESQRTAEVRVVSDYDAYLQMVPLDPGIHTEQSGEVVVNETIEDPLAYYDDMGHLALDLSRVNSNSTSWFDSLFLLQNTQDEPLCVWIEDDIEANQQYGDGHEHVSWYADEYRDLSIEGETNCVWLEEGESIIVGAVVDSHGLDGGTPGLPETGTQLIEQIFVQAESFKDGVTGDGATMVAANSLVEYDPGELKDGTQITATSNGDRFDPSNALGNDDGDFVSLGFNGSIEVQFATPIYNTIGTDGRVVEITYDNALYGDEFAEVYAITGGGNEVYLGTITNKNDPFGDPDQTRSFFTMPAHLSKVVGIKLVDVSDKTQSEFPANADGFDVDSIKAYDP